jgi:cysteine desulfurase
LKPIIFGGGQEFGMRSGTENTQSILAFAEVVKNLKIKEEFEKVSVLNQYAREFFLVDSLCHSERVKTTEESSQQISNQEADEVCHCEEQSDVAIQSLLCHPDQSGGISSLNIVLNSPDTASPYILSLSFEGVRGETLVHMLEKEDIIIGTGSACSSKKGALNRTLEAMGKTKSQNEGAIRISFSNKNTLSEVQTACEKILLAYKCLLEKLI